MCLSATYGKYKAIIEWNTATLVASVYFVFIKENIKRN